MNKILLTGSTGFIGSELLKKLSKDNKIYITLRKKNKTYLKSKNINHIYFKDYDELNYTLKKISVNTVIHCATHYVKHHKESDIKKLSDSNILFGNIILENLDKLKVKKFINFTTVWENYNGIKDNHFNLYSVYKKNFNNLIRFYKKKFLKIEFFNLVLSDTFGENDKRKKLINTIKKNYIQKKVTKIISKKLYLNLINVEDIVDAVQIILRNNIETGKYILKNSIYFNIFELIKYINKNNDKKIKIKWLSNTLIKDKIFKYKKLKSWNPKKSNIEDIKDLILN